MRIPSTPAILLVLILILAAGSTGIATAESELDDDAHVDLATDSLLIEIHLPGGDIAIWTIEHRYRLDDDDDIAAFESLRADIEADPDPYVERFRGRIDRTAEAAETATGREMAVLEVAVETERRSIPHEYGMIRYSFVWQGFAVETDNDLQAGDAIAGMFLDDTTNLRITWSESYSLDSFEPEPTDHGETAALWRGPVDFTSEQPRIVLVADGDVFGVGWTVLASGGLVIVLIMIGWRVFDNLASGHQGPRKEPNPPQHLRTNEEQVLTLIEEGGGRIKQQEVVNRLGWTDAKTSKVVTTLREDGKIETLRIGRENVLSLPDNAEQDE